MHPALPLSLCVMLAIPGMADATRDLRSGRLSDLTITVTGIEDTGSVPHKGTRHTVTVFVSLKNEGKSPVCMSFTETLKVSYGLTYIGTRRISELHKFPQPPEVRELLPGEETSGSYTLDVKDGVKPLEFTLKHSRKTLQCGSTKPSLQEVLPPGELTLDVHDLPAPGGKAKSKKAP